MTQTTIHKRSIVIKRQKTSVSLEQAFWLALRDIAASKDLSVSLLVESIDTERRVGNLSSALCLYVLDHYRQKAREATARPPG